MTGHIAAILTTEPNCGVRIAPDMGRLAVGSHPQRGRQPRWIPLVLCLLVNLFMPGSLLAMALAADPASTAADHDAIVGAWEWSDGTSITIHEDGTFNGQSAQGEVSGKWKILDAAQRQYKLLWKVNDEVKGVETVTLATDGKALSGQDADGKAVSGKRQEQSQPTGPGGVEPPDLPPGGGSSRDNEPGNAQPFTFPSLDLSLKVGVKNGKLVIASVAGNPIAEMLKLKVGDRVLKIGGRSADGISAEQAQALLRGTDGTAVDLEILRVANNEHVNVSLPGASAIPADSGDGAFTVDGGSAGSTITRIPEPGDNGGDETGNHASSGPLVSSANQKQAREFVKNGALFARAGRWPEAEAEYRKALRLDPGQERVWRMLGQAFSAQKKWKEAASAYRAAVRLSPDTASYHADLAQALLQQGLRDEASKEVAEAIRLQQKDARKD